LPPALTSRIGGDPPASAFIKRHPGEWPVAVPQMDHMLWPLAHVLDVRW